MRKKASSHQAFETLFREYFRPLTIFAKQYVKVQEVAEDIVQDLFLYLHEKGDFEISEKAAGYHLYKLVRYRCLNHIEYQRIRKKRNPEILADPGSNPHDPFESVARIELEHKYLQAIESLSPKCREVFQKSRMEGRKNQEIADEMNLSKRTVETHISQALKIMRKKLYNYLRVLLV
jgi:RNA polymerase sigma-70 factor (ECF subfamily)